MERKGGHHRGHRAAPDRMPRGEFIFIFVWAIRLIDDVFCLQVSAVHDTPGLTETLRGVVLNVNVPNLPKDAIRGVKLTKPGVSCTQAEWVRVPGDESPNGKGKSLF